MTVVYPVDNDKSKHTGGESQPTVWRPKHRAEIGLWYAEEFGWVALPAIEKRPLVRWRDDVLPTLPPLDELAGWWERWPDANIAVLTGRRSGIVVGDVDPRHGGALAALWARGWPQETPLAQTGGGGWHVYAACPPDGLRSVPTYAPGVEVKADGALVLAPPSRHPATGRLYEWAAGQAPWEVALAPLPEAVLAELRAQRPPRDASLATPLTANDAQVWRDVGLTQRQVAAYARARYQRAVRSVAPGPSRKHRNEALYLLAAQLYQLGMPTSEVRDWCAAFCEEVYGND